MYLMTGRKMGAFWPRKWHVSSDQWQWFEMPLPGNTGDRATSLTRLSIQQRCKRHEPGHCSI
jgi:hypothetical protein